MRKPSARAVLTAALCIFIAVFAVSAFMLCRTLIQARREENAFADLAAIAEANMPDVAPVIPNHGSEAEAAPKAEAAAAKHWYDGLLERNGDLFGWVRIDGTEINYPVMYTPDAPEKYLHLAFDGTSSASGVPFMDGNCSPEGPAYLVYGHNMRNGSMFHDLSDYKSEDFCAQHPKIRFYTLDREGEYEVMAVFYSEVYDVSDETAFKFYNYTDLSSEDAFDEYVQRCLDASMYDTGVTASFGDRLLTLTTCSYQTSDGRFVVVAREKG